MSISTIFKATTTPSPKKSPLILICATLILNSVITANGYVHPISLPVRHFNHAMKQWQQIITSAHHPSQKKKLFAGKGDEQYGIGMDQNQMMESDTLIVVDSNDNILSDAPTTITKKQAHLFSTDQPRGIAHRAFSVFLFNKENKLLLTRRALGKITFPGVWTNTCCSHPLFGMTPNEVDEDGAYPDFPGIKHGAIRKMCHELGMDRNQIPHDRFQFIARFHYWAADTGTYGKENTPWGEHEVDYVLFIQCNDDDIQVVANPEEVDDWKYVAIPELRDMVSDEENTWSPWFLGIMERGGWHWWENLQHSLEGKFVTEEVEFFDPPKDFWASYNLPSHDRQTGVWKASE